MTMTQCRLEELRAELPNNAQGAALDDVRKV